MELKTELNINYINIFPNIPQIFYFGESQIFIWEYILQNKEKEN